MSVFMVFHFKLEKPIRRCDLKVIEKVVLPDHASAVSNRFSTTFSIEPISFSVAISGSDTIKLGLQ